MTLEFRDRHKDNSWLHLEAVGQNKLAEPEICGVVVNSRDVTIRWRAQKELRSSEEQYRLLFQGTRIRCGCLTWKPMRFLEVNEAAIQHYGYSREEFLAMTLSDIRVPEKNASAKGAALDKQNALWFGGIGARTVA